MKFKKFVMIGILLCALVAPTFFVGCGHTHKFTEWVQTKEPTCTQAGEMRRDCESCDFFETSPVQPLGHAYGEWHETTHPSCLLDGEKQKECTRCGDVQKEKVDKLGHEFSKEYTKTTTHHYHACIHDGCSEKEGFEEHTFTDGKTCDVCGFLKGVEDVFRFQKNSDGQSYTIIGFLGNITDILWNITECC